MLFLPLYAFAADGAEVALIPAIMALWAAIQTKASTSIVLVPVFQILRSKEIYGILEKVSGNYLRAVIAIVTAGSYVAEAWSKGGSLIEALISGLFTAGGAMIIYTAFRDIKAPSAPAVV
jgi:hypothetical protein